MILNIGSEVLSGKTINTNAAFIADQLEYLGIDLIRSTIIGDDKITITEEVNRFLNDEIDLMITTGGLGPTHDDFTKEVICEALGLKLVYNAQAAQDMYYYFGDVKNDCNVKQAYFPIESQVIPNPLGTADGMILEYKQKHFILLVGPPFEMEPMFLNGVVPYLSGRGTKKRIQDFITMGGSESAFENILLEKLPRFHHMIAPYANNGIIRYRISARDDEEKVFLEAIRAFKQLMEDYIISESNETIEMVLVRLLTKAHLRISFAESCTGGMMAMMMTSVPGASHVLHESLVTYSPQAKTKYLHVSQSEQEKWGVVSKAIAHQMAQGLYDATRSEVCIAVTGYAGPEGDPGKVCYAIKIVDTLFVE